MYVAYQIAMSRRTAVYVLELEDGKYYVGSSDDPEKRFLDHVSGQGAAWTREHWPIRILKIIEGASVFEEDKVTKEYMAMYGIDNVRGGSYVLPTLPPEDKRCLKKEIWMAKKLCMRCGRSNHFVTSCFANRDICGEWIEKKPSPFNNYSSYSGSHYRTIPPEQFPHRRVSAENNCKTPLKMETVENSTKDICMRCGSYGYSNRSYYRAGHRESPSGTAADSRGDPTCIYIVAFLLVCFVLCLCASRH